MHKFIIGVIMGIIITAFFYIAVMIDSSTVKLPFTIMAVLIALVAVTIYLAYRFYKQDLSNKS
ncbi:hypothetical protein [Marinicella gelatinilytica]|uniref:hypothetical protein n=1 Tax=Marinicella gelatinilytica TaxID=2996017 RepID=UPI002260D815|nr:hypothetical protein [Marinicella gelatinilytica]MCX7546147.1 hypothetical protein [Marinicella gelatinilytica]